MQKVTVPQEAPGSKENCNMKMKLSEILNTIINAYLNIYEDH